MHLAGVGGLKPPIHFHCVLHAKSGWVGGWVQRAYKIAYVLNGRPPWPPDVCFGYTMMNEFLENSKEIAIRKKEGKYECIAHRGLPLIMYAILHAIWTHFPTFCM